MGSWYEENWDKTPEQIAAETGHALHNDLYQPEKYQEIIGIAETQGIGRDIVLSIAQQAMAAQYGDDINNAMARLDFVMQAVGRVRPDLEAEMRKNTIRAVRCILHAVAVTTD